MTLNQTGSDASYQLLHFWVQTHSACLSVCCSFVDGPSMWASVTSKSQLEPNYSSIEQLFCLPLTEPKDKSPAAPLKKEPKEVWDTYIITHRLNLNIELWEHSCNSNSESWRSQRQGHGFDSQGINELIFNEKKETSSMTGFFN